MRNQKGFTLIELVIVLAVIAILMAVIIPAYRGMQMEGEMSEAEAEINTIKTAVISYRRHNGAYPPNIHAALVAATPKILTEVLDDPFGTDTTNSTYGYISNAAGGGTDASFGDYFIIYSHGPDRDTVTGTSWNDGNDRAQKTATTGADDIVVSNGPIVQM